MVLFWSTNTVVTRLSSCLCMCLQDIFRRLTTPTLKKLYRFVLQRLVGRFLDDDIALEVGTDCSRARGCEAMCCIEEFVRPLQSKPVRVRLLCLHDLTAWYSILVFILFFLKRNFPGAVFSCSLHNLLLYCTTNAFRSSMVIHIASMDQPGKVATPARGQLNREN